jgi:hypothetical protein
MRFVLFLVLLLAACGGGTPADPPQFAFFSDSLLSGDIAVAAGEPARKIDVPPLQRIEQLAAGSFTVVGFAVPGTLTAQALATHPDFASMPAQALVFRYGGSDVVLGTAGDAFQRDLTTLVQQAVASHKRVVLIGLIHSVNYEARAIEFDGRIRAVALAQGLQFIDTQSLAFAGGADLVDGIHPNQDYSDRQAALIVDGLRQ